MATVYRKGSRTFAPGRPARNHILCGWRMNYPHIVIFFTEFVNPFSGSFLGFILCGPLGACEFQELKRSRHDPGLQRKGATDLAVHLHRNRMV